MRGLRNGDAIPNNTQASPKMPDYSQGKVYRILQDNEKTVYIGSTTQPLSGRMAQHRKGIKHWPDRKLYKLMAEVGVEHFGIELIVDFACERGEQLRAEEGRQQRLHKTVEEGCNYQMAGRSQKDSNIAYRNAHKEELNAKGRESYDSHREERKAQNSNYRDTHREETKARHAEYRANHQEKLKAYREAYKEERKVYAHAYNLRTKAEREAQAPVSD